MDLDMDVRPARAVTVEQATPQVIHVWFGQYRIATYRADKQLADRYAAAMAAGFAGLHITTAPAADETSPPWLPDDERQWALTGFGGAGR
ncbi:hypothetical protein ACFV9C_44030 [Kribbella sp. NPDC059898]|uniref:hypothetical protein n=1 Tax=Kribbella sp. NPDC059898 TaxID=3346995 RepID=UPI0036603D0F